MAAHRNLDHQSHRHRRRRRGSGATRIRGCARRRAARGRGSARGRGRPPRSRRTGQGESLAGGSARRGRVATPRARSHSASPPATRGLRCKGDSESEREFRRQLRRTERGLVQHVAVRRRRLVVHAPAAVGEHEAALAAEDGQSLTPVAGSQAQRAGRAWRTSAATARRRGARCARHQREKNATSTYVNLPAAARQSGSVSESLALRSHTPPARRLEGSRRRASTTESRMYCTPANWMLLFAPARRKKQDRTRALRQQRAAAHSSRAALDPRDGRRARAEVVLVHGFEPASARQ